MQTYTKKEGTNHAEYRHLQADPNTESMYLTEGRNYVSLGAHVVQP